MLKKNILHTLILLGVSVLLVACSFNKSEPADNASKSETKTSQTDKKKKSSEEVQTTKKQEETTLAKEAESETSSQQSEEQNTEAEKVTQAVDNSSSTSGQSSSSIDSAAIVNGDFSSLVGTWQNDEGKSVTFDSQGLVSNEYVITFLGTEDGKVFFSYGHQPSGSTASMTVLPVGKQTASGLTFSSDAIVIGQSASDDNHPYYRLP